MFYYFGRKGSRLAESYPAPLYDMVIEPFAGSMAYTLHHRPRYAIGIEADERVVELWWRLRDMTLADIRAMPVPEVGDVTTDLYWMLAFASNSSLATSYRTVNEFIHIRLERQKRLTIRHHSYVKGHVLYQHGDYTEAPDIECTWFIDPPYQDATSGYRHHKLDYEALAEYCLTRQGQVIVCEGRFGNWLAFQKHNDFPGLRTHSGARHMRLIEKVWVSEIRVCRCGARFKPLRAHGRYCSDRCRLAAFRAAQRNA